MMKVVLLLVFVVVVSHASEVTSSLKQALALGSDVELEEEAGVSSDMSVEVGQSTTGALTTTGTCTMSGAVTMLGEDLLTICQLLKPFGMSITTNIVGANLVGTFTWNSISFLFTLPANGNFMNGIQIAPPSPITVTLAQMVGAFTDGRLSAAGLSSLSFTWNSVALATSAWSAQPSTLRFSGSVSMYNAVVPFDMFVQSFNGAYSFGLGVGLTSVAPAAFGALYTKLTGRTDSFFTLTQLTMGFGTPSFSLPLSPLMQPVSSNANVIGGLTVAFAGTMSTTSSDPAVALIAKMIGGSISAYLAVPASGPILLSVQVGNYTINPSTTLFNVGINLTLPQAGVSALTPMAAGSVCTGVPAGALGITVFASVATSIGSSPVVFTGSVSAVIGSAVPTVTVCLSMMGTLTNVFGFSALTISNVGGSLSLTPEPPYFAGISMQGTMVIGTFSTTVALFYNENPALNYAFVSLNSGLTLAQIVTAFGGNAATLPAWFGSTGFGAGSWLSYSASPQTLLSGATIPAGIAASGSVTLVGFGPIKFAMAIQPTSFAISLVFPVMTLSALKIYGSSALTSGPSLAVATSPFLVSGQAWFVCPEFSGGLSVSIGATSFAASGTVLLMNDLTVSLSATLPMTGSGPVSFSASLGATGMTANTAFINALKAFGNILPTIPTQSCITLFGRQTCAANAEYTACNDLLDDACEDWNTFVTDLQAGNPSGIGLTFGLSGTLGGGATTMSASIGISVGDYDFGPYTISYSVGATLGAQWANIGNEIRAYLRSEIPTAKYISGL